MFIPLLLEIKTLISIFIRFIEINTTILTKKTSQTRSQIFSTAENNQSSITIKVNQGERK